MHIFTGPPGSGKDTLLERALRTFSDMFPNEFTRIKTSTTRPMRVEEINKPDKYDRFPVDDFERRWSAGEFVERNLYSGHHYGLRWVRLLEACEYGLRPMMTLDFNGAVSIMKSTVPWIVKTRQVFFIDVSSQAELRRRMIARNGGMPPDDLEKRLEIAEQERANSASYPDIIRILNDDVAQASEDIACAIKFHRERLLAA